MLDGGSGCRLFGDGGWLVGFGLFVVVVVVLFFFGCREWEQTQI